MKTDYETFYKGIRPEKRPEYIGLVEEEAIKKSLFEDKYYTCHIAQRNNFEYPYSCSLCADRIVLKVKDNIVIEATQG